MDPSVWKFLLFEILELLFHSLPLSMLIKFQLVCKEWSVLLENPIFLVACNQCANKEFVFISLPVDIEHNFFVESYLNEKGHISPLIYPFLHFGYIIQCTVGLMIVFSMPLISLHSKKYFIVNPFTKTFRNLGRLSVGEWGFTSLLEKFSPQKYDWVMLKHVCKNMESYFFIRTSVDMVWRRKKPPFGGVTPQRRLSFIKEKFLGFVYTKIMMITFTMVTLSIGWIL